MSQLAEGALAVAAGQVGQKENPLGSNWGHPVQDYLASVDIHFPASWCMAFMYWSYSHAAGQQGIANPLFKTGGVLAQWSNRPGNRVPLGPDANPQPGDIFIMDHGGGLGHTGIVESVDADGTLHTIEGNTNDTGSREGIEVDRKIRKPQAPIIGYLRF